MNSSVNSATPKSQHSKKRELTSLEFEADSKKNKSEPEFPVLTDLPPLPESPEVSIMAAELGHGSVDVTPSPASHILIPPSEMLKLSEMLKETFRGEISTIVIYIIIGVLQGLQDRISSLEKSNSELRKENKSLTARVAVLESQADQAEQYRRRNCLRISGYHTQINENTDDIVLKLASDIDSPILIQDIDRSHRVGNPNNPKRTSPRDIIVKFAIYRARAHFYRARTKLKVKGHEGVFVNEDLTKKVAAICLKTLNLTRPTRFRALGPLMGPS